VLLDRRPKFHTYTRQQVEAQFSVVLSSTFKEGTKRNSLHLSLHVCVLLPVACALYFICVLDCLCDGTPSTLGMRWLVREGLDLMVGTQEQRSTVRTTRSFYGRKLEGVSCVAVSEVSIVL
jgi:hypothetical protein